MWHIISYENLLENFEEEVCLLASAMPFAVEEDRLRCLFSDKEGSFRRKSEKMRMPISR